MNEVFKNVRIPGPNDNVYKDECVYSFDNPESENGLFVCMSTFFGYGKDHVARHCKRYPTKNVFLHILRRRKAKPIDPNVEPTKVTKMAIGVEGGFDADGSNRFTFEEKYSIYIHPDQIFAFPDQSDKFPDLVKRSAEAIIAADSAFLKEERAMLNVTWNGEVRRITKHAATLKQLDNGRRVPPNGWKCDQCDLKENLWLNLTDGSILCGRRFYDGTGGNNHAVDYYNQTRFPLAVKLGTITSKGADVYSYDEDHMVEDPNLAIHLSHWGINMMKMEKTDRTMADLEIELNQKFGEASMIEEANSKLKPVHGPGYTGMKNLGNSCYLNSVLQVLFTIKDFQDKYYKHCDFYFDQAKDPVNDFNTQTAKLAYGLLSGLYSHEMPSDLDPSFRPPNVIRPQMFRSLIGRGHHEFGTKNQQDAAEFLEFFIEEVHKHCLTDATPDAYLDPSSSFQFQLEERIYCPSTNQVRYVTRDDTMFRLNVPLDAAKNMHEVLQYNKMKEDLEKQGKVTRDLPIVRPVVPLVQAIARWAEPEVVNDFKIRSGLPATTIRKTQRFITFPDFLIIQMKKYTYNDDWTPRKIDVSMDMPDEIDLNSLRATGLQHGENPMGDDELEESKPAEQKIDDEILRQLMDMGFGENGCKRALFNTGNNNAEAAMNWIFEHQNDSDFDTHFEFPNTKNVASSTPSEENIALVMSMGFARPHALRALTMTNNNVEAAVDWACANPEENATIQTLIESLPQSPSVLNPTTTNVSTKLTHFRDGHGKYRLVAFISHIGTKPSCGHYVSHILKDGRWVIFNDETVALSEHPPKDLAYLYIYKRTGQ